MQRKNKKHPSADYQVFLNTVGGDDHRFWQDFQKKMYLAIRKELTKRQRQVLYLYYTKGKKGKEIAQMLGIRPTVVSQHRLRAEAKLRHFLSYNMALHSHYESLLPEASAL